MSGPDVLCGTLKVQRVGGKEVQPSFFMQEYLVTDEDGRDLILLAIDRAWIGDELALSQFMVQLNEVRGQKRDGLATVELVDREEDFALVGYPALAVPTYGRVPRMATDAWQHLANDVAQGLAVLHGLGQVHGCLSTGLIGGRTGDAAILGYGIFQACTADAFYRAIRRANAQGLPIAPEVGAGQLPSPASDSWGWATTMASLALGSSDQATVTAAIADARDNPAFAKLHPLLRRCLSSNPGQRPRDGEQLLADLRRITGDARTSSAQKTANAGGAKGKSAPLHPGTLASIPEVEPDWQIGELTEGGAELLADGISLELESHSHSPERKPVPPPTRSRDAADLTDEVEAEDFTADLVANAGDGRAENSQMMRLSDLVASSNGGVAAARPASARTPERPKRTFSSFLSPEPSSSSTKVPPRANEPTRATSAPISLAPVAPVAELKAAPWQQAGSAGRPQASASPPSAKRSDPYRSSKRRGLRTWLAITVTLGLLGAAFAIVETKPDEFENGSRRLKEAWRALLGDANDVSAAGGEGTTLSADSNGTHTGSESAMGTVSASASESSRTRPSKSERASKTAAKEPEPPPCSEGMVAIDDKTCIDEAEFPGRGALPRVSLTFRQAQLLCNRRRSRLCSLEEWSAACSGGSRGCNLGDPSAATPDVRPTAENSACRSQIGTFDQIGNVGEWVIVAPEVAAIMGGDVVTSAEDASCRSRWDAPQNTNDRHVGFRCCADR